MTLDMAVAAAERTETARQLIGRAQADVVDLVTVSALELCVLGGPRHRLFEESVCSAWRKLGNRRREKVMDWVTEGMVERGLLIDDSPRAGFQPRSSTYSLRPELGIMLAARCRPAFVVVTETAVQDLRTPRFFALSDQSEPVRGIVAELPAALPPDMSGDFPQVRKLGPLGMFYRYVLMSRERAAAVLAELTISPPRRSGQALPSAYSVRAYHPDRKNPVGYSLSVRGDGTKARLEAPGAGDGQQAAAEYDVEGLRAVMLDLLTQPSR
ncbi:MAG: hypothetical protein ABSA53_29135 [Streptosporangiaceae bacterium]|jgi:hypothetical protein